MENRREGRVEESVLDLPQEGLCPDLWEGSPESPTLVPEAARKIQKLVQHMASRFKMKEPQVHLVGSLMSNSYSSKSDIDVHFCSDYVVKSKVDTLNKMMRREFEEYAKAFPSDSAVGSHPLEVYFQANPAQDMMSVGCYDFTNKEWLVGPDLKSIEFDPYREYFTKSMDHLADIIDDVREAVLKTYELAFVVSHSRDSHFKEAIELQFAEQLQLTAQLFTSMRAHRTAASSPETAEQAQAARSSEQWKVADASFKLMDKFGYIAQLHLLTSCWERVQSGQVTAAEAAEEVLNGISDNFSGKSSLDDSDLSESVKSMLTLPMLAFMLSVPGLLPAAKLAPKLKTVHTQVQKAGQKMKMNNKKVKDAMENASKGKEDKSYHGLSKLNVVNALAMVLWLEARGEGIDGIKAVLSVVMNRCGWDPAYIPDVLKMPSQFECISRFYHGGWKDADYQYFVPWRQILANPRDKVLWDQIQELALQAVDGKFQSTVGDRNAYMNKAKSAKSAVDSWGNALDLTIGSHDFGYLREYDGKKMVPGTMKRKPNASSAKVQPPRETTVVVKKGDSLSVIAKSMKTTVAAILKKNPQISNPDKLQVGQTLKV